MVRASVAYLNTWLEHKRWSLRDKLVLVTALSLDTVIHTTRTRKYALLILADSTPVVPNTFTSTLALRLCCVHLAGTSIYLSDCHCIELLIISFGDKSSILIYRIADTNVWAATLPCLGYGENHLAYGVKEWRAMTASVFFGGGQFGSLIHDRLIAW